MSEYTAEELALHRKEWVDALRSGKYEQGKERLHRDEQFCCLGVACDISGLGKWQPSKANDGAFRFDTGEEIDGFGDINFLPIKVSEWLGLKEQDRSGKVAPYTSLAHLNDNGTTFAEIADIIAGTHSNLKMMLPVTDSDVGN